MPIIKNIKKFIFTKTKGIIIKIIILSYFIFITKSIGINLVEDYSDLRSHTSEINRRHNKGYRCDHQLIILKFFFDKEDKKRQLLDYLEKGIKSTEREGKLNVKTLKIFEEWESYNSVGNLIEPLSISKNNYNYKMFNELKKFSKFDEEKRTFLTLKHVKKELEKEYKDKIIK